MQGSEEATGLLGQVGLGFFASVEPWLPPFSSPGLVQAPHSGLGCPGTSRAWWVWVAGTQAGKVYMSYPVSRGPTSLGQVGSGPGFQEPFCALRSANLSPTIILCVLLGRAFPPGIPLLAHLDVLVSRDYSSWHSPKVDLLIQLYIFLFQALGKGSQRVLGYIIKWKRN